MSFFDDDDDEDQDHPGNNNDDSEESDLVDLENRIRKPDTVTTSPIMNVSHPATGSS